MDTVCCSYSHFLCLNKNLIYIHIIFIFLFGEKISFDFFFLNKENDFMRFYVFDGFCQVVPLCF